MGQEIPDSSFNEDAFVEFARRLADETVLLSQWEQAGELRGDDFRLGYELEGWLVGDDAMPAPDNQRFLETMADDMVVPELARFNFELNAKPLDFGAGMFDAMQHSLLSRWQRCQTAAQVCGLHALSIGILPTVRRSDLTLDNISAMTRYKALNEQVFRLRNGRPIQLKIDGAEALSLQHNDVMLEAGATSLQIHLQVGSDRAVRAFNASKIASAAMVALGANSPFLFERQLWAETRIPLFEQAVAVGQSDYSKRVTFGIRYAENSIIECFEANRDRYPILLPDISGSDPDPLAHLRLHNGTVWRWNRPLVGFDGPAKKPHYRIEHRVVAAGNSSVDMVADTAFFIGLMMGLMHAEVAPETQLPFEAARDNFYQAARYGLQAQNRWLDGHCGPLDELILQKLLPMAGEGLVSIGLHADEISRWLSIIEQRLAVGQTGAAWQIGWIEKYGKDWPALVQAYIEQQQKDVPVHRWSL